MYTETLSVTLLQPYNALLVLYLLMFHSRTILEVFFFIRFRFVEEAYRGIRCYDIGIFILMEVLVNRSGMPKLGQSTHLNKNRTIFSGGARAQFERSKIAGSGKC